MLKQTLAFGFLIAVPGCTINITTDGPHEGSDHHEWHEEKEEWHGTEEEWLHWSLLCGQEIRTAAGGV